MFTEEKYFSDMIYLGFREGIKHHYWYNPSVRQKQGGSCEWIYQPGEAVEGKIWILTSNKVAINAGCLEHSGRHELQALIIFSPSTAFKLEECVIRPDLWIQWDWTADTKNLQTPTCVSSLSNHFTIKSFSKFCLVLIFVTCAGQIVRCWMRARICKQQQGQRCHTSSPFQCGLNIFFCWHLIGSAAMIRRVFFPSVFV